ncbi:MAG: DUF6057 family protein [Bacteroidia bacterium]|nr:DUF6057 family protein [Bacteroidia bacterium]
MKIKTIDKHLCRTAAGASFLAAFGFFLLAYPYHLMRREQLNLFLYDWSYIKDTYKGMGWLSRFAGDFVDQFLCIQVVGPVLIALILTGIGAAMYRICRHGLGKWPSLGIAAAVFIWAFLRETGNTYITQYSLAILGYLALLLLGLQFKKKWTVAAATVLLLAAGVLTLGRPWHRYYGSIFSAPSLLTEKLIALDINAAEGDWDKVLELSEKDLHVNIASYYYNLACAEKGIMGDGFFNHSQGSLTSSLFLWVNQDASQFSNGAAGEVWFRLGDMTQAEQSAVVALQISPKHTGVRFITRLAEITLIAGEDASAQKYLNMLSKTLFYRKWARERMPGRTSSSAQAWLNEARTDLQQDNFVFDTSEAFGDLLKGLVESNPENLQARQYLLMYDLVYLQLDDFMKDYSERMIPGAIYQQAVLVWLIRNGMDDEENFLKYGITEQTLQRLDQFTLYPERYRNTFWYYFMSMTE